MTGHGLLPAFDGLDWEDLPAVSDACAAAFAQLTGGRWALLEDLLEALPKRPALVEMCESYDFLDKLVVHDDPERGYRVRLHRFRSGYFDRPHNHRWTFGSMILTGSYRHVQYGSDTGFQDVAPDALRPLQIRTERAGDWYALHHSGVHAVTAQEGTVSLVLRGPAAKPSFRIIDLPSGTSFHVKGAAQETAHERADKRMGSERLMQTVTGIQASRPTGPAPRED